MRTNYEVREYRGCGIEYTAFQGSLEECNKWLNENCHEEEGSIDDTYTNLVANDPSCVNGNGFEWKYFINVSTEK